ncbi:MAG: ThiF family adenylyltransferase [Methylococcales bacterium]
MGIKLRMTGKQHTDIKSHVIAPDGHEAGSLLFCEPVFRGKNTILLVKEVIHIPYKVCSIRTPTSLSWPTEMLLMPYYEHMEKEGLSLIMIHSHPSGFSDFSDTDNKNDLKFLPRLTSCIEGAQPHGSAIMLPDGSVKARIIGINDEFISVDMVSVAGDDIRFFGSFIQDETNSYYIEKTAQVYGSATTDIMRNLIIGVVGCSGTGSPTAELLLRYHAGHIIPIDFDKIEDGNLNRMLMSRVKDTEVDTLKVDRYADWVKESGLPTIVTPINGLVPSEETIEALSKCDVVFGCIDNVAARHALNKIACSYLIPYFDLGVAIKGDKKTTGNLRQVIARCHYLQPDKSGLLDRGAFSSERLRDENFRRDDPEFYKKLKELGYTNDTNDIQAVMVVTMEAAVMAIDDLMARLHGYRIDPNKEFDEQERSFTHGYYEHRMHSSTNNALHLFIASGDKHKRL